MTRGVSDVRDPLMSPRKKLRPFTLYLLKDATCKAEDLLRNPAASHRMNVVAEFPFSGALFIRVSPSGAPWWSPYLQPVVGDLLGVLPGFSASAVLILDVDDRRFAYTFGHGAAMLSPGVWEQDFGLMVTVNAVDPDRIRTVDVSTIEELTLHTSTQASLASPMNVFGIDVSRDLLRAVRGEPRDLSIARRLGGADGLRFEAYTESGNLGSKARELLKLYESDRYKRDFGWINHLRRVGNPRDIETLDAMMLATLTGPSASQPHLAPPEPLEWDSIDGFSYSSNPGEEGPADLALDDYLLSRGGEVAASIDELKRDRILEWRVGTGRGEERWSVYECIVCELAHGGGRYILTRGRWFRVDQTFADEVLSRVESVPLSRLALPRAVRGEAEKAYNLRASRECGLAYLDTTTGAPLGARGQVEFCDLLSRDAELVHVKWWARSSTLSHLFAQGAVSAETLLRDAEFRNKLRAKLAAESPEFKDVIPVGGPDRGQMEVVYCVIGKARAADLPFFSQLAMSQAVSHLQLLGVRYSAAFATVG